MHSRWQGREGPPDRPTSTALWGRSNGHKGEHIVLLKEDGRYSGRLKNLDPLDKTLSYPHKVTRMGDTIAMMDEGKPQPGEGGKLPR